MVMVSRDINAPSSQLVKLFFRFLKTPMFNWFRARGESVLISCLLSIDQPEEIPGKGERSKLARF